MQPNVADLMNRTVEKEQCRKCRLCRVFQRRKLLLLVSLLALFAVAANSGSIVSLSASGGGNFNETITINATVRADDKVNNSNFYFEIRAADGSVVATNNFGDVPSMESGNTFSYSWQSNNGSYPLQGDYSVSICWSPGNSNNCNIASATTSFYSANTLGPLLTVILVALVGRWLFKRRDTLFGSAEAAS